MGLVSGLTQWVKGSGIATSCGVGCRHGSDLALLWLWQRLAVVAPIRPLAWEPPYVTGTDLKRKEREREEEGRKGGRAERKEERIGNTADHMKENWQGEDKPRNDSDRREN